MSFQTSSSTSRRKGFISLSSLFWLILLGSIAMAAYLFIPPYFDNWKLSSLLRSICTKAENLETPEQVKDYAIAELRKQQFEFTPDQVRVTHVDRVTSIDLNYVKVVHIPYTDVEFQLSFEKHGTNAPEN